MSPSVHSVVLLATQFRVELKQLKLLKLIEFFPTVIYIVSWSALTLVVR